MNFIFNLMEVDEGVYGGYNLKEGRPLTGETLLTVSSTILGTKHSLKEMDCTSLCSNWLVGLTGLPF